MTDFRSEPAGIQTSPENIYHFLGDFNNFEKLMPDQVINWQSTTDTCSFTIKGMADLAMKIDSKVEYSSVRYASAGNSPFPFSLGFAIESGDAGSSRVTATLSAKLNPMLKMMASRPLQNFVNLLVDKLREVMEAS